MHSGLEAERLSFSHLLRGNTPVPSLLSAGHFCFSRNGLPSYANIFYRPA
uniref:Uncharacterized protein n=1 Tax=Anguilla anguilla TaxID=7936 RepID=A0A0E9SFP5_ANGAN